MIWKVKILKFGEGRNLFIGKRWDLRVGYTGPQGVYVEAGEAG